VDAPKNGGKPMSKRVPPLTEEQIKQAEPITKIFKLYDGCGLMLLVMPTGTKTWRVSYRYEGTRYYITIGRYPELSLDDARIQNADIRILAAKGINPIVSRKEQVKIEKDQRNSIDSNPRISFCMGGAVEIRKGRDVVRLTKEEAVFVKNQLALLI
jgi:hypothetical protein